MPAREHRFAAMAGAGTLPWLLGIAAGVLWAAPAAHAGCNLIPGTAITFNSVLGTTNRPFAAPGENVEIGVRGCDTASPGLPANPLVTVVFTPPSGPRHAVVLTADADCATNVNGKLATCAALLTGGGTATCVPLAGSGVRLFQRDNVDLLGFRFPDTDAQYAASGDGLTLTGPVAIAVSDATDPQLPCSLATTPCAGQSGLRACIDRFYANDGNCGTAVPNLTFSQFTALPVPNDYQADCFADAPPCTGLASELRFAADVDGNLLLPVSWTGVLLPSTVPVPRLLRTALHSPLDFAVPDQVFVGSYTPEGGKLPPIFEPIVDPNVNDPNTVALFGSVDAPYTILRIARRHGTCSGGPNAGQRCSTLGDCLGSPCNPSCRGDQSIACANDSQCGAAGPCGKLFDLSALLTISAPGPIQLPRPQITSPVELPGICQETIDQCSTAMPCASGPCVNYALRAESPVTLDSLAQDSTELRAFSVVEPLDLADHNGDGDHRDRVAVLRDRVTGVLQPLGADPACGIAGTPDGRAVVSVNEPPFSFPAVAVENDILAMLESEPAENFCDINNNGDRADAILRVFRLGTSLELTGAALAVDAAPVINGRSVAISNGRVFARRSEAKQAHRLTEMINVNTSGGVSNAQAGPGVGISADGRYVAFGSLGCDLVTGGCSPDNGFYDVFVRDRCVSHAKTVPSCTPTTVLISTASGGGSANGHSGYSITQALNVDLSANGRWVAFSSLASNLVPGDGNGVSDVFVYDRCLDEGVAIPGCVPATERISVGLGGVDPNGASNLSSFAPVISDDGRYVSFISAASNLVAGDTNALNDAFVRDRLLGVTERVSVDSAGNQALGGNSAAGSLSADGRYVAFFSHADNLVPTDINGTHADTFVRDRLLGTTEIVSLTASGAQSNQLAANSLGCAISADGRYVAFLSDGTDLVPGATEVGEHVYLRDRDLETTELISTDSNGAQHIDEFLRPAISADGRYVAYSGSDFDDPSLGGGDSGIVLHDRVSGISEGVERDTAGQHGSIGSGVFVVQSALSADGSTIAFSSTKQSLVPFDTTSRANDLDIFVRGPDPADAASDLNGDGDLDDTPLMVFDTATSTTTTLCPADAVSVADGSAAYLRVETAAGAAPCAGGSLNGDGDTADRVVQLWTGGPAAVNLHCAATAVAMSATWVGALLSEAGEGSDLNGDVDQSDTVAAFHRVAGPFGTTCTGGGSQWVNTQQAAVTLTVSDSTAVFLTDEADQGSSPGGLNGDGDALDRVLQVYSLDAGANTATPAPCTAQPGASCTAGVRQAAEDFAVGDQAPATCGTVHLVAFRTRESAQGNTNLNAASGDTDTADDVLQVYDAVSGTLVNTGQAVTPCTFDACDPRQPYRVNGSVVKFLTLEADQNGLDLDGNGSHADLVLQSFDFCTGQTITIGPVDQTNTAQNPLDENDVVIIDAGRCGLAAPASCSADAQCDESAVCDADRCTASGFCLVRSAVACGSDADCGRCVLRQPSACRSDTDCPDYSTCIASRVTAVAAVADADADGIPDAQDNCPDVPNPDQNPAACGGSGGAQLLGAKKILLKDKDGDASKRKLVLTSKDAGIVAPAPSGGDDPTISGAQLTLHNPLTSESESIALPIAGWKGLGKPAGVKGYKYKDPDLANGPCKTVLVKPGKLLKAVCKGAQITFALSGAAQGSLGVALDAGSTRYCLSFSGAEVTADTPAAGGGPGVFKAQGGVTLPPCPVP